MSGHTIITGSTPVEADGLACVVCRADYPQVVFRLGRWVGG